VQLYFSFDIVIDLI